MPLKVLAENTSVSAQYGFEHELSLWVRTARYQFLFDAVRGKLFYQNARTLSVDLVEENIVILTTLEVCQFSLWKIIALLSMSMKRH